VPGNLVRFVSIDSAKVLGVGGGAALLPSSVSDRYAVPGVHLIELLGDGPTLESAVVTRPDVEHLSLQAFLRAVTHAAKPRPALRRAA